MGETINLTAEDGHKLSAYKATPTGTPRGALVVIQDTKAARRSRLTNVGSEIGQPAIDSRLLVIASCNNPVFDWTAFEFVKLPPENFPVKRLHCLRIVRVNLKMSDAIHMKIVS